MWVFSLSYSAVLSRPRISIQCAFVFFFYCCHFVDVVISRYFCTALSVPEISHVHIPKHLPLYLAPFPFYPRCTHFLIIPSCHQHYLHPRNITKVAVPTSHRYFFRKMLERNPVSRCKLPSLSLRQRESGVIFYASVLESMKLWR